MLGEGVALALIGFGEGRAEPATIGKAQPRRPCGLARAWRPSPSANKGHRLSSVASDPCWLSTTRERKTLKEEKEKIIKIIKKLLKNIDVNAGHLTWRRQRPRPP